MDENKLGESPDNTDNLNLENEEYVMPEQSLPQSDTKSSHSPTALIVAVLILVALLAGIGAYIYFGMQNTPATTPAPEVVSDPDGDDPNVASQQAVAEMQARLEDRPPATPEQVERMRARLSGQSEVDIE